MRISITRLIRRPVSLWIALAGAFVLGVVAGSIGIPAIWRDVTVYVVGNATEHECSGSFGITPIRFGRVGGAWDGSYTIPCEEFDKISDTVWLRCECPKR